MIDEVVEKVAAAIRDCGSVNSSKQAIAAIAALEAAGLVLMPVEPTEEILDEVPGFNILRERRYKAMVEARPRLGGEGE